MLIDEFRAMSDRVIMQQMMQNHTYKIEQANQNTGGSILVRLSLFEIQELKTCSPRGKDVRCLFSHKPFFNEFPS
jgi:hypothetical protein